MLEALRCSPVASGLLEHQFQGRPPAQVLRAANAVLVLLQPAGNVERYTRIEAAVGAAQDI